MGRSIILFQTKYYVIINLLWLLLIVVLWILYSSSHATAGCTLVASKKLPREINQNQEPIIPVKILSFCHISSTFLSIHAQLNSATFLMRTILILIHLLLVVSNCLSALMVLFLIPQQPLVIMTLALTAHIFWSSLARSWYYSNFSFSLIALSPQSSGIATPIIWQCFSPLSTITKCGHLTWTSLSVYTLRSPRSLWLLLLFSRMLSRIYMVMPNAMKCSEMHITEGAVQE